MSCSFPNATSIHCPPAHVGLAAYEWIPSFKLNSIHSKSFRSGDSKAASRHSVVLAKADEHQLPVLDSRLQHIIFTDPTTVPPFLHLSIILSK